MNILNLTLKKKWFDMILSGEKTEEYREIKKHWFDRLINLIVGEIDTACYSDILDYLKHIKEYNNTLTDIKGYYGFRFKKFDCIIFSNGYQKNSRKMTVEFKGITIGKPKPEWSDNSTDLCFVLKLGKILNYE